jgi:hypothetical protein
MTAAKAVAVLRGEGATAGVHGVVRFFQPHGGLDAQVHIVGRITGLTPGSHGLRVLLYGDESEVAFKALGGVYNPYTHQHGALCLQGGLAGRGAGGRLRVGARQARRPSLLFHHRPSPSPSPSPSHPTVFQSSQATGIAKNGRSARLAMSRPGMTASLSSTSSTPF